MSGPGRPNKDEIAQRRQRIRRAVISAVHHDELAVEIVFLAERIFGMRKRLDRLLMRPRRDHHHLVVQPRARPQAIPRMVDSASGELKTCCGNSVESF